MFADLSWICLPNSPDSNACLFTLMCVFMWWKPACLNYGYPGVDAEDLALAALEAGGPPFVLINGSNFNEQSGGAVIKLYVRRNPTVPAITGAKGICVGSCVAMHS